MPTIANRYEFVLIFDVTNGNPNGDPDAGNRPRLDPETNVGLVTDVCLKRKIRNCVSLFHGGEPRFNIYLQDGAILNQTHRMAYEAVRPGDPAVKTRPRLSPKNDDEEAALRRFMCDTFFDVRAFGAVMSTGVNCGQVRGPVQVSFAQSVEPILPLEITITRMAATKPWESRDDDASENPEVGDERHEKRTMGRKHIVPYALYCVIRRKATTGSTARRPGIPVEADHWFRSKASTDSGGRRPPARAWPAAGPDQPPVLSRPHQAATEGARCRRSECPCARSERSSG